MYPIRALVPSASLLPNRSLRFQIWSKQPLKFSEPLKFSDLVKILGRILEIPSFSFKIILEILGGGNKDNHDWEL